MNTVQKEGILNLVEKVMNNHTELIALIPKLPAEDRPYYIEKINQSIQETQRLFKNLLAEDNA